MPGRRMKSTNPVARLWQSPKAKDIWEHASYDVTEVTELAGVDTRGSLVNTELMGGLASYLHI